MSNCIPIHECESEIDHYKGHYVPYSLQTVCGFCYVPQIFYYMCKGLWDGAYGLLSLSEKTRKSNRLQMRSWKLIHFLTTRISATSFKIWTFSAFLYISEATPKKFLFKSLHIIFIMYIIRFETFIEIDSLQHLKISK